MPSSITPTSPPSTCHSLPITYRPVTFFPPLHVSCCSTPRSRVQPATMDSQEEAVSSELESFRQQWLSDLRRARNPSSSNNAATTDPEPPSIPIRRGSASKPSSASHARSHSDHQFPHHHRHDEDGDYLQGRVFDEPAPPPAGHTLSPSSPSPAGPGRGNNVDDDDQRALVTALDHYEEAMARESEGNMGESLKLYRRAYRVSGHG
jgi:F-box protein 9